MASLAAFTENAVVVRAALQRVACAPAFDHIRARPSHDQVGGGTTKQDVRSAAAENGVCAAFAIKRVFTATASQQIRTVTAEYGVVAGSAEHGVGATGGADDVIAGTADDPVRIVGVHDYVGALRAYYGVAGRKAERCHIDGGRQTSTRRHDAEGKGFEADAAVLVGGSHRDDDRAKCRVRVAETGDTGRLDYDIGHRAVTPVDRDRDDVVTGVAHIEDQIEREVDTRPCIVDGNDLRRHVQDGVGGPSPGRRCRRCRNEL